MVKALVNLQIYRSKASLFSGKDSVITVRDLLKWADRVSRVNKTLTVPEIAMEGFLLFAERARNPEDRLFIKTCLE